MNGNTIYGPSNENDPMEQLKRHLNKYQEAYILFGCGVVSGVLLGSIFRKKPKIDQAAIVWRWMEEQVNNGFNIYALSNEQKELWEACWMWVVTEATRVGASVPQVANILAREFVESKVHIQTAA